MERVILHSDANSFYASVECLYNPSIRDRPVAVCGDPKERHGIVLTANPVARQWGLKTGMAVWQARQACPGLVTVRPNYLLYLHFARLMRGIYQEYSDRVEPFGLDEAWMDLSGPDIGPAEGKRTADEIRRRIREELGITVSLGVSFNKVLAKLGSDLKKPDATTVLSRDNFKEEAWGLPVSKLLYVGPRTAQKLAKWNIRSIGDLAACDPGLLEHSLGKNGLMLQSFARGFDASPVRQTAESAEIQSIGNSTTPPRDIADREDARCVFYLLSDCVAARLREHGFKAGNVSISTRNTELLSASCQRSLRDPSNLTGEIAGMAMALFEERFGAGFPYRSVGLSCGMLHPEKEAVQLDLLGVQRRRERAERAERAVDELRRRYGHRVILRGVMLSDRGFTAINPKEDSISHPVPFFAG